MGGRTDSKKLKGEERGSEEKKEWQRGTKRGRGQGRGKRSMQEERKGRCEKVGMNG